MEADPDEHGEGENGGQRDADGAADGHEGADDVKEEVGRHRHDEDTESVTVCEMLTKTRTPTQQWR